MPVMTGQLYSELWLFAAGLTTVGASGRSSEGASQNHTLPQRYLLVHLQLTHQYNAISSLHQIKV